MHVENLFIGVDILKNKNVLHSDKDYRIITAGAVSSGLKVCALLS